MPFSLRNVVKQREVRTPSPSVHTTDGQPAWWNWRLNLCTISSAAGGFVNLKYMMYPDR